MQRLVTVLCFVSLTVQGQTSSAAAPALATHSLGDPGFVIPRGQVLDYRWSVFR